MLCDRPMHPSVQAPAATWAEFRGQHVLQAAPRAGRRRTGGRPAQKHMFSLAGTVNRRAMALF